MPEVPVVVVRGDDHTLRVRVLEATAKEVLAGDDRTLALAEFVLPPRRPGPGEEGGEELRRGVLDSALSAARTPPFGTLRRVVVVRSDDGYAAGEAEVLSAYLADPEPTTVLVLEAATPLPAGFEKTVRSVGGREAGGPTESAAVLAAELEGAGLRLDREATELVLSRLGSEAGGIPSLVEVLVAVYGPGAELGVDDVYPYVVEEGAVPVYELTKAIDAGDVPTVLGIVTRFLGPMGMHPLQVLAVLHAHFCRLLRLDDPAIRSERDAVEALGGRVKAYPAKLAWQQARRLGTEGIAKAFELLAKADLDLRGLSGVPEESVVEVLVTELALLSRRARAARAGARSP